MAIFSTLRSRRFATENTESSQQTIAFRLQSEWFAVPILAIQKVVPLGTIYGDPQQTGISLTSYNQQELLVIDVARCIFNHSESESSLDNPTTRESEATLFESQRYLIVLEDEDRNLVGLPTDVQPVILRVAQENFKSLPEVYLKQGNIQCVSSKVIDIPNFPLVFMLDPQQLTKAQFNLVGTKSNS